MPLHPPRPEPLSPPPRVRRARHTSAPHSGALLVAPRTRRASRPGSPPTDPASRPGPGYGWHGGDFGFLGTLLFFFLLFGLLRAAFADVPGRWRDGDGGPRPSDYLERRNLVVAHGGTIAAESRTGDGTTIRFTLPARGGSLGRS